MPVIDNNSNTLLQGLSDFWTRFYSDTDELNALYRGTEVLFAQAYLDILSAFLNISVVETPVFNTELFKLFTFREDNAVFVLGTNPDDDRHVYALPDNVVEVRSLQNKVYNPTAAMDVYAGYEIDATDLELDFVEDPSGYPGKVLGSTTVGETLAFGLSASLVRVYVSDGSTPFAAAKPGHWVKILGSGSGNNHTYRVTRVVDGTAVILTPGPGVTAPLTTPDANTGALTCVLLDSAFTPALGYAHRIVNAQLGGSFDDATQRATTEIESWYMPQPAGLGVRKGDVLRITDRTAVPRVPADHTISVIRNGKLYLSAATPLTVSAAVVDSYAVLRRGPNADVTNATPVTFAQSGVTKSGALAGVLAGTAGTPAASAEEVILETTALTLVAADRQRYVTLSGCGVISWTATIAEDGTLTRTAGMLNAVTRAYTTGTVTISGSVVGNNGTHSIASLVDDDTVVLAGQTYVPEAGLTVTLDGTYVKAWLDIIEGAAELRVTARNGGSAGNSITVAIAVPAGAATTVAVVGTDITITPLLGGDTVTNIADAINFDPAATLLVYATESVAGNITASQAAANLHGGADGMTNNGTYLIKKWISNHQIVLEPQPSFPDPNNGAISWTVHDGYKAALAHANIEAGSVSTPAMLGDAYTGGRRSAVEGTDYRVNYETGSITQIRRLAGTWGLGGAGNPPAVRFDYSWLLAVFTVSSGGAGVLDSTATTLPLNETAMWGPDVLVDRFNLYNNYGYLINRFEASSESYREFIRGVFQLYLLGPTLERIESALNVIAGFPVIRDDGEVLAGYDSTSDPDYNIVTTTRPGVTALTATYQYPKGLTLRADIQLSANYGVLTFESFEALTLAFQVSDYVQDPAWWTDMVIPQELMPNEPLSRRRTVGALIENVIGAWDNPKIGDPGLFIGADDEGIVPPTIATYPAKRRKMANVAMERFLKWNMFFVRFDDTVVEVLDEDFVQDLVDLVLVAKPGYRFMYVESYNPMLDTMLLTEGDAVVHPTVTIDDTMVTGEDALTIQSFSWNIGDVWRRNAPTIGQALAVADGASTPPISPPTPISLGATHVISKFIWIGGTTRAAIVEDIDYTIDYAAGTITPLTFWPAGTYTIDFTNLTITAAAGADPSLGDTPYLIGGLDPAKVRSRRDRLEDGVISTVGTRKVLTSPAATFSALHRKQTLRIYAPAANAGVHVIGAVLNATQVMLDTPWLVDGGGVTWAFPSEEPSDGRFYSSGGGVYGFVSASALFRPWHVGRYIHVKDAVNGANNARHLITEVISMSQVTVGTTPVVEAGLHWRLEGSQQHMDLVERPLQITVT